MSMQVKAIKTRIFRENEDLLSFILKCVKKLPERSIVVVTSKIVALSEGRTAVLKNKKQKIDLIKKESTFAVKTPLAWLTIKDGTILASAGIDESNANGKLILLPKDSFTSARSIRKSLQKKLKLKKLGVIITDSRVFPLRAGVVGVALGYAGFKGIRNYMGKKDIFGRVIKISRTDVADSLATSAVVCMGEGNEQQPLALIADAPVEFAEGSDKNELYIDPREDLYLPFLKKLKFKGKF